MMRAARSFVPIICALFFGIFATGLHLPATPEGVQCPTVVVQQIRVPVLSCCGKVVGYSLRAPRLGEQGFTQCRCNEKKSAGKEVPSASKPGVYLAAEATSLDRIAPLPPSRTAFAYDPFGAVGASPIVFHPPDWS